MEETGKLPVHVSIIMDGNGRWAKERGKERVYGHFEGVESVRACTEAAVETGVKYLSLFAFSEENWGRPDQEVNTLMGLMFKSMQDELPTLLKNDVRFVVLGNRARLSDKLNAGIDDLMARTASCSRLTLIVFLSYSGKWDILQARRFPGSGPHHPDFGRTTPQQFPAVARGLFRILFHRYPLAGFPERRFPRGAGRLRASRPQVW